MIVSIVVILLFVTGLVLSGNETGDCFTRPAIYLHKLLNRKQKGKRSNAGLLVELRYLYPGESPYIKAKEYEVKKIALILKILLVGSLFCLVYSLKSSVEGKLEEGRGIRRGELGDASQEVILCYKISEERGEFLLTIPPREYAREELVEMLPDFYEELEKVMLGENPSFKEVYYNLNLPEALEGYPFDIVWYSSDYEYMDNQGRIQLDISSKVELSLTAKVSFREEVFENTFLISLLPEHLSEEEKTKKELMASCLQALKDSKSEEWLYLPDTIRGEKIVWGKKKDPLADLLMLLVLAVAIVIYPAMDQDLYKKTREQRMQMLEEYPALIHRFTLLLGAGMSIRAIFYKMAEDYGNKDAPSHFAISKELLYVAQRLRAGQSEMEVYEDFGKRSGLREYARFSTLLVQNLRKGNGALLERLREESRDAMAQQRNLQKKKGEEAETKLLFPMVMMLFVIMVMIMYPALTGMGI